MANAIMDLSREAERDEIYWDHVDRIVVDELRFELQKED